MKLVKLFTLATALMAMVIVPVVHAQPVGGRQGGQGGGYRGRTVSWKGDGSLIAVGTLEGDTLVFDATAAAADETAAAAAAAAGLRSHGAECTVHPATYCGRPRIRQS